MTTLLFAAFIGWIIFNILVKVVKFTVATALLVVAVVVIIQVSNGINHQTIWKQINQAPQSVESSPSRAR
jgi:hypothetical protein